MILRERLKSLLNNLKYIKQERGAIFVLTALMLPILFGFLGIGYDVGNLYMHKARLQHAADAASLAGARAFVNETVSKRKTYKTQYMNNNNVTSIPADAKQAINLQVKTEAKTAAKNAAVANVNQNMINLPNNDYQSAYSLITGMIHDSGKDYQQQYFKAYLREKVPLYFLPVIWGDKEADVAVEAISTIINMTSGGGGNNQQRKKFGPDSLFMVKSGFSMEGDGFYNDGSGNTNNAPKKAPTWTNDYFEGDLRFTGDSAEVFYGNKNNLYSGDVPFDRVFNKKALELMTALKKLMNGYNETDYNAFLAVLQTHPDFYENGAYTAKGSELLEKTKAILPGSGVQYDHAFWGVYGAFYEELASNPNYYRTFQKLENYNMDKFGDAIKSMFKSKLAAEQGISAETYEAQYQAAHDAWVTTTSDGGEWKTEHDNWKTEHDNWKTAETEAIAAAQAQIEQYQNNGGSSSTSDLKNLGPREVYNVLKKYEDILNVNLQDKVWTEFYEKDGQPFGMSRETLLSILGAWPNPLPDTITTWSDIDWNKGIDKDYIWINTIKPVCANSGKTPQETYVILQKYKNMLNENLNDTAWQEYNEVDGHPFDMNRETLLSILNAWPNPLPDTITTWSDIDWNKGIDKDYIWIQNIIPAYSSFAGGLPSSSTPTLEQLMASWYADSANAEPQEPVKPREPLRTDFIQSTDGDEYYAQYHGSEKSFTASGISQIPPSKEHSYFYYPAATGFDLTIDSKGFYTDDNITTEDPFYIYLGEGFSGDVLHITLEADVNRPLIFCYMGTSNPKIHIALNGHTFQGIIYTPNSYGGEVHMNVNGNGGVGTFKGTWMSQEIMLKQASSHFQYEEYYLDPSLEKAMPNYDPTQQEDSSGGDDTSDDDIVDANPIKVIKLVKDVEEIISVEQID